MKRKFEVFLLLLIFGTGFLVRLYRFNNPIADWHSWRQADTSAVSRNFIKHGFDVLHPRFDDLSNVASGLDNPNGYRFVEFPIYNLLQAGLFRIFGYLTIEEWGRMTTIVSSLLSALFLFLLAKKYFGKTEGFFTAFFFLFFPFSIYYSRTILPDEMMVTAILGGTFFFDQWTESSIVKTHIQQIKFVMKNYLFFILAILFTASSLLLKPYALFFTLPMIYIAYRKFGFGLLLKWQLWIFLIISVIPLAFWRIWMLQYPQGIPASGWLFDSNGIRFKGSFFYWIFGERLSKLILGYTGTSLFVAGVLKKLNEKEYGFSLAFLTSSLLYLFVLATGNVQHDYYQILIVPTAALFAARGVTLYFSFTQGINKITVYAVVSFIILSSFAFSWYYIRDYFNINNPGIVAAGNAADMILPKDAKVIAPYDGDTSFLYQTNRQGWPAFEKPIEDLIKMGAQYLIIANPTPNDFSGFGKTYRHVASSSSYLILKLK